MVKGVSRQVIVVHAPEPKLFDQAIFILNENAAQNGITEEALLKEAEHVIRTGSQCERRRKIYYYGAFWAGAGALAMGAVWLAAILL